jgi:hypothetical protein
MEKFFTYEQLGRPTRPTICAAADSTQVGVDPHNFEIWKSLNFATRIRAVYHGGIPGSNQEEIWMVTGVRH